MQTVAVLLGIEADVTDTERKYHQFFKYCTNKNSELQILEVIMTFIFQCSESGLPMC